MKSPDIRLNKFISESGLCSRREADRFIEKGNVFTTNAPTIIWLSYNVHGNETSSSEVAMKVLYELTNTKNYSLGQLKKTTIYYINKKTNRTLALANGQFSSCIEKSF